jgi:GTP-binding protein HflX
LFERPERGERAILVRIGLGRPPDAEELGEFDALARSAGAVPVATITGNRKVPEPRFFVGSGKAEEIRDRALADSADVILVDHELSPSQERNLERLVGRRVLDRAGLILDIFASRARSAEGKLEVELAHLERQKGGIGLRGPGETQLETDRRLIGKRIRTLAAKLEKLAQRRDTGRQVRKRVPVPGVALIGYTNAGKSTLFRALTGADAYVADQLFATLDPTVRRLRLPHTPDLVVADTVGFVRELPHELVAAFRSTLMEAREADLLLHVVDAADPDRDQRIGQVDALIASIGAAAIPQLRVYNKIDRLGRTPELARGPAGQPSAVWLSSANGAGVELLRGALQEIFGQAAMRLAVVLPPSQGRLRAKLYALRLVRAEEALPDGNSRLLVESSHQQLENLCREAGVDFGTAVSPCLPGAGFVEFKRDAASSAA